MPHRSRQIEECPLSNQSTYRKRPKSLKGPLRVLRLCVLGIFFPGLLVAVPLYMRYHVYGYQLYPLAMSDMRVLDNRVSTTWCQKQLVSVNTTFNAFLLPDAPKVADELKPLSMVRHLVLEDDTKEYWGFYLLQGSTVTVSTCVRWPGASLIIIRGHKHLHECAYIGDDSSEELDEIMEAIREGTYIPKNDTSSNSTSPESSRANRPNEMKRHRQGVEFHHPTHRNNTKKHTLDNLVDTTDITDPEVLKKILNSISSKANKKETRGRDEKKDNKDDENQHHVHRNSTIAKGEQQNFAFLNTSETTSSDELVTDIVAKLQKLGAKGTAILEKVNAKLRPTQFNEVRDQINHERSLLDVKGRHYAKPPVKYNDEIDRARRRRRRELEIQTAAMANLLNEHDEENDAAIEEGFVPDGIADDRGTINETTLNDKSNSEFWSSFSSSEEALLNCAGLILNLPLTPHRNCHSNLTEKEAEGAYLTNTVTYKVPTNGYYFFVFNSENEIQPNYIRVLFHIKKAVYNLTDPVEVCTNSSEKCAMNLKFFSSEKLVMELPVQGNDSLWNEEYVVISECEPRTAIYVFCVIAVPIFVVLFGFM